MLPDMGGNANYSVYNEETALKSATVNACVRVIAEAVAGLPLKVYRRTDTGRELVRNHPISYLFSGWINERYRQTRFEWLEQVIYHLELRGNAYNIIKGKGNMWPSELIPVHPDLVRFERISDTRVRYHIYDSANKETKIYSQDQILHFRKASLSGDLGMSTIEYHRESIEYDRMARGYGRNSLNNTPALSGYLKTDQPLTGSKGKEVIEGIKERWKEQTQGAANAGNIAVLGLGMEFKPLTMSPADAQFIQSWNASVIEICRIFGVPPHKVAELSRSTYSNIEQQAIEFVQDALRPRLVRLEQTINTNLLIDPVTYYVEFDIDGILRGDINSRFRAYAIGITNRFMNPNEARSYENMPAYEGGDEFINPNINTGRNSGTVVSDATEKLISATAERIHRKQAAMCAKGNCDYSELSAWALDITGINIDWPTICNEKATAETYKTAMLGAL